MRKMNNISILILLSLMFIELFGCSSTTAVKIGSSTLKSAHKAFQKGDYRSALNGYEETLKKALENDFEKGVLIAHYNIGNTYVKLGERSKALDNYERALTLSKRIGDYTNRIRIEDKISTIDKRLKPPYLVFKENFKDENHNGIIEAGEKISLTIKVTNSGEGLAEDVTVRLVGNNSILLDNVEQKVLDVGRLNPRQTKSVNFTFYIPYTARDDKDRFSIKVTESSGKFTPASHPMNVIVKPYISPKLSARYEIDDDMVGESRGNENNKIDIGERIELGITISNRGGGTSLDTKVHATTNAKGIELMSSTAFFGNIPPGRSITKSIVFFVNGDFKGEELPLNLKITEKADCCGLLLSEVFSVYESPSTRIGASVIDPAPLTKVNKYFLGEDIEIPPKTKLSNPNAVAVVIGNRDYKNVSDVKYALKDAISIENYLINVMGYKENNIYLVKNATQSDFTRIFGKEKNFKGELYNSVKEGKSDVFIYYSGHGAPGLNSKKSYFVPVNADPKYIEFVGYQADIFYENLSKLPAKSITVVIDACFSGANIINDISPVIIDVDDPVIKLKNGVVISSSQARQVSTWLREKEHGLFTYFFLKAIHNKNADYNNDKQLTYNEIFDYISDNSEGVPYYARRIHGIEQTPTMQGQIRENVFVKY